MHNPHTHLKYLETELNLEKFRLETLPRIDSNTEDFEPRYRTLSCEKEGFKLIISQGCIFYSDKNSDYRDEYIVHNNVPECRHLLDMVAFYHMSLKTLDFCDIIEVGSNVNNVHALYISVPFFLPSHINNVEEQGITLQLKWLMPISKHECEFIRREGAVVFEDRLFASRYDFFDPRPNGNYLDVT